RVEPSEDLADARGVSLTAWIQPTTTAKPDQGIISTLVASDDAPGGFALVLSPGLVRMAIRGRSGGSAEGVADTALMPGAWHFVAGVDDRAARTIRVFHWAREHWPVPESSGRGEASGPPDAIAGAQADRGLVV